MKLITIGYLLLILSSPQKIISQDAQDYEFEEFIIAIDTFYQSDFLLNNGRYYVNEYSMAEGHPFFTEEKWITGDLVLNGKLYKNIKMAYDIFSEKVLCVITRPKKIDVAIKLNIDNITSFDIKGHKFINSKKIELKQKNGLYEILYLGNDIQVFASWKKEFIPVYTVESSGKFDEPKRTIYLVFNKKNYIIKKNKDLINIFIEHKKQIKSYARKHHIKLSKSNNNMLNEIFKFTEELLRNNSTE